MDPISQVIEAYDQRASKFYIDITDNLDVRVTRKKDNLITTMNHYERGFRYCIPLSPVSPTGEDFLKWITKWWVKDLPIRLENVYAFEHDEIGDLIDNIDTMWIGVRRPHARSSRPALLLDAIFAYSPRHLRNIIHQAAAKFAGHSLVEIKAGALSEELKRHTRRAHIREIREFYADLHSWARGERIRLSQLLDEFNPLYVESGLLEDPIKHRQLTDRYRR